MIYFNGKEITPEFGGKLIAIYKAGKIIWQKIISCFSKGYWINSAPWTNDKGWKNNE